MIFPVLKRFPFKPKSAKEKFSSPTFTTWMVWLIHIGNIDIFPMLGMKIHPWSPGVFISSPFSPGSWSLGSGFGQGEDRFQETGKTNFYYKDLAKSLVQNMCILPKKDSQGEDFLVVQVVKWPVIFRNTWFFIVLGYDLSLDALTCLAELRDPPRGLWWSTACGGDLVIYLLDAIEAWDAGGLLERLREDLGSPSTLAKAGRWWMGCWTMAMDALECLGVDPGRSALQSAEQWCMGRYGRIHRGKMSFVTKTCRKAN